MAFLSENEARGLAENNRFQFGLSNVDSPGGPALEAGVLLPVANQRANWVYYDVALGCLLDSGIVVHRTLPQVDNTADTLASCTITDADIDKITGRGVNLVSNDRFSDVVQRMAHSRYWFKLWGEALRIGQQVPIPGIKKIAGQLAIPHDMNPQWAYNKIVGNYSGAILYYAQWSLWYTIVEAPTSNQAPMQNPWQHVAGGTRAPDGIQAPFSAPDDLAQPFRPVPPLQNPIRG